jgi:methylated-DNA-[protein]-cysteine S-methyltransferase
MKLDNLMYEKFIESTPFGPMIIIWSQIKNIPKIRHIIIPKPDMKAENQSSIIYPDLKRKSCPEIDEIAEDIASFLEGEDIKFSLHMLSMDKCTEFQKTVLNTEYQIPRGKISSYKLIASHIGKIRGSRAVGNALARNPFPIIIPCHRAIRSDLHIGGFQGGLKMKKALLENEGIHIDDECRVTNVKLYNI